MRTTLLFVFTLFLTACSDNSTNRPSTASDTSDKQPVIKQTAATAVTKKTDNASLKTVTPLNPSAKNKAPINGHNIYIHKCASCHGKNGEKMALNKSQVITGWEKKKTAAALKGYQDGSYGSSMKAIMKGQVSALSDLQIEAVSEYIATL